MSQYLRLRCGAIAFLLDVDSVQEVGVAAAGSDSQGRRLWREQQLAVMDMGRLLQQSGPGGQQVVVRDGERQAILDVDAILGLREIATGDFQPLPPLSEELRHYFDAVAAQPDGSCLLRLRRPMVWLAAQA